MKIIRREFDLSDFAQFMSYSVSRLVTGTLFWVKRLVGPLCVVAILDFTATADQMTGELSLTKGDGRVVAAYEAGDRVFIRLKDSDRNGDGGVLDEVRVLLTSETENTGTHASAGDVTAGSDNQGDGVLTVLNTGYDTKTEEWTVTCVNVEGGNPKFDVVGSVSGNQTGGVTPTGGISYRTDGGEVAFRITQGSTGFGVLDSFKFPTTAGEIKGEQITLKETGADTGVFSAEVEMDASGDAASDAKLQISSGDYVTVFYDDPKGDFGDPEQVRAGALYSQRVLSGATISSSVIWTAEESPYLLTGDVMVNAGATLTIQKGVKVIFLAYNDDTKGGELIDDSELIVKGSISVQGTEAEPVTFTTSESAGRAGQWGGIKLEGTSASGEFKHVVVEYGTYGIYFTGIMERQVRIEESVIRYNSDYGIRAERDSNGNNNRSASIHVINSDIVDNSRHGIYAGWDTREKWEITGCNILRNGEYGVYLERSYHQVIKDNVIKQNWDGAQMGDIHVDYDIKRIISGNEIAENKDSGLRVGSFYLTGGVTATGGVTTTEQITNNKINSNGSGLSVWGEHNVAKMVVTGNEIKNNKQGGGFELAASLDNDLVFENNVIENNEGMGWLLGGQSVAIFRFSRTRLRIIVIKESIWRSMILKTLRSE